MQQIREIYNGKPFYQKSEMLAYEVRDKDGKVVNLYFTKEVAVKEARKIGGTIREERVLY